MTSVHLSNLILRMGQVLFHCHLRLQNCVSEIIELCFLVRPRFFLIVLAADIPFLSMILVLCNEHYFKG